MRYPVLLVAGAVAAWLGLPTATIAQLADRPRLLVAQNNDRIRYFGITTDGDDLELNTRSIYTVGKGTRFVYYINGIGYRGFTSCDESVWYSRGRRIPAESQATRAMLNYVCDVRATRSRQRLL